MILTWTQEEKALHWPQTGDCPRALGASKTTAKVIAILENMIVNIHF